MITSTPAISWSYFLRLVWKITLYFTFLVFCISAKKSLMANMQYPRSSILSNLPLSKQLIDLNSKFIKLIISVPLWSRGFTLLSLLNWYLATYWQHCSRDEYPSQLWRRVVGYTNFLQLVISPLFAGNVKAIWLSIILKSMPRIHSRNIWKSYYFYVFFILVPRLCFIDGNSINNCSYKFSPKNKNITFTG